MKTTYFIMSLSLASVLGINLANATVYIVNAQGTTIPTDIFVPKTTNALVGDTIKWIWVSGVHTTESISIPAGAAPWASDLNSSTTTFSYVVTKVGTYNYDCHASTPHGMNGSIVVAAATGIPVNDNEHVSSAYPNPFADKIMIEAPHADFIYIYNRMGQKINSVEVKNGQTKVEIDVAELTKGIYLYSIIKEGVIVETRKLVKR